jgi:hypothetical protein
MQRLTNLVHTSSLQKCHSNLWISLTKEERAQKARSFLL